MAALKTGSPNQALLKLFVFFIQYNVLNASRIVHMMDIMCVCNGPPLIPIPWRRQCSAGSFVMCTPQRGRKATCPKTINNVHFNLSFNKSIVRHSCPVFSDDAKRTEAIDHHNHLLLVPVVTFYIWHSPWYPSWTLTPARSREQRIKGSKFRSRIGWKKDYIWIWIITMVRFKLLRYES